MATSTETTHALVEHFFRHESGKVMAHLTRSFGTTHLELIEDAVQDALFKAMKIWPYNEVPDNPSGWIMRVARNRVIDVLRHHNRNTVFEPALSGSENGGLAGEIRLDHELEDDQLRMFFACCQPGLSPESQIILVLKLLCGFSKTEIAQALLKKEEAVAKAFTRAKNRLKVNNEALEVPIGTALEERLDTVLQAIYLLFNEGYHVTEGDALVRKDLCAEAIRLAMLLQEHPNGKVPKVQALLALMCFQASRLDARMNARGELIPLVQQDRSLWNRTMISYGSYYLALASTGQEITAYHLEATIAAEYSLAVSYEATNWNLILKSYNLLLEAKNTPVVKLNRVVVFAKVYGPEKALEELKKMENEPQLQQYHRLHAIKADLLEQVGKPLQATSSLQQAIRLARNEKEQAYLEKKLTGL